MSDFLRVENLCISYKSNVVVNDISFNVPKHSVTAILGPSGSGKSSILKSINRLIDSHKQARVTGKILIGEEDILKVKDLNILRKKIAMLFQSPNPLPFSIKKNLEIVKEEWSENITVESALEKVGLLNELSAGIDASAMGLSGGQKQRLCLARALMSNPEILLLDEPCSSLDPISTKLIEELIVKYKEDKTIIFVTHDMHQARRVADQVIFIWPFENGAKIIEQSSKDHFFSEHSSSVVKSYLSGEFPDISTLNLN